MLFDLSIQIQQYAVTQLQANYGEFADIRARIKGGEHQILRQIGEFLDEHYSVLLSETIHNCEEEDFRIFDWADQDQYFHQRVRQLIFERVMSEPLAANVNVLPKGLVEYCVNENIALPFACPRGDCHGVIVEYLAHAVNEIYPLMIDAYVYSLSRNLLSRWNVIGVQEQWLDEEFQANRGFYYDPNRDQIIEREFIEPLQFRRIQSLCVSPKKHVEISARAIEQQINDLNPYIKATRADDKYACYQQWKEDGILTPKATLISLNENVEDSRLIKTIKEFFLQLLEQHTLDVFNQDIKLFLQPNHGTEGRGTRMYSGPMEWEKFFELNPELLIHARNILAEDDLILRQGIGNVLWCELPDDPGKWFDIRLNVVDNAVESGYLMIGDRDSMITSPGIHGRVVEWSHQKEWLLRTPDGLESFDLNHNFRKIIEETTIAACKTYSDCRLLGIDIRLCKQEADWQAWVLDVNPRPSGLSHSRYIKTCEPGVSLKLWDL